VPASDGFGDLLGCRRKKLQGEIVTESDHGKEQPFELENASRLSVKTSYNL